MLGDPDNGIKKFPFLKKLEVKKKLNLLIEIEGFFQ